MEANLNDEDHELCLEARFGHCNLMRIQINQSGIKLNACDLTYYKLLQKAGNKNPESITNIIHSKS